MTNETINVYGSIITLESSGASISDDAFSARASVTYGSAISNGYPDVIFYFSGKANAGADDNSTINIYARPITANGTAPVPDANYKHQFMCDLIIKATTAVQNLEVFCRNVPKDAGYYLENTVSATVSAGWSLKVRPLTEGPAV